MRAAPLTKLGESEVRRLRAAELTYPVSTAGTVPAGYRASHATGVIGQGRDFFERAGTELFGWQVLVRSGIAVSASAPRVDAAGPVVARILIPVGPLRFAAFARVVSVVDEPDRRGFAYGTLPGHPQSGWEQWVIEIDASDRVRMTISAFARPVSVPARLGGPVTRWLQAGMKRRFLRALEVD